MAWDSRKENIQPLREGRKPESLTPALLHSEDSISRLATTKEAHLLKIKSALGLDDPIVPYLDYIKWYREVTPILGVEFFRILKECLRFVLENNLSGRYSHDPRYIQIWLSYADSSKDAQSIYEHMRSNEIGTTLALFYEAWSRGVEEQGDYVQAETILSEGIRLLAQPTKLLTQHLSELRTRAASFAREMGTGLEQNSQGAALTTRSEKFSYDRAPIHRPPAQLGHLPQVGDPRNFSIHRDLPGAQVQHSLRMHSTSSLSTRDSLGQENVQHSNKWIRTQPAPSSAPASRPVLREEFSIYADPHTTAVNPTNTGIPKNLLKEIKVSMKSDFIYFQEYRPSERARPEPNIVPCYPYWEVYPVSGGQDISFEELRAGKELSEVENDSCLDMEFTCMDRATENLTQLRQMRINPKQQQGALPLTEQGYKYVDKSPDQNLIPSTVYNTSSSDFYTPTTVVPTLVCSGSGKGPLKYEDSDTRSRSSFEKSLNRSSVLSRSRSFEETLSNFPKETHVSGALQKITTPGSIRKDFFTSLQSEKEFSSQKVKALPSSSNTRNYALNTTTEVKKNYGTTTSQFHTSNPSQIFDSSIPALSSRLTASIASTSHLSGRPTENPDTEDTSMTTFSRRAEEEILKLFDTTLPSEKEDFLPPETVRAQKNVSFHIHLDEPPVVPNKELDASTMPPPSRTLMSCTTPVKKGLEVSVDSSLALQPTSTPMGPHKIPLGLEEDITQIQLQEPGQLSSEYYLRRGKENQQETQVGNLFVRSENQENVPLQTPPVSSSQVLSPINEASDEASKSGSTEEGAQHIDPFDIRTARRMVSEYRGRKRYGRLLDYSSQSLPSIGNKKLLEFEDVHFKILKQIGAGGFANVYLGLPLNSEAESLSPEQTPVLKVILKQPSCIEFLIADKIQGELCKNGLLQLCASFYRPYACIIYNNATILISEYYRNGTLLDLINQRKQKDIPEDELVAASLALEVLYLVEVLHSIGIIHNDIKPDNFLVRTSKPITSSDEYPKGSLLHLIDFGSSVDLTLFPKNVQFVGSSGTETFELRCMKEGKPYLHNSDSFGVAATLYCILAQEYPRTVQEPRSLDCKCILVRPVKSLSRRLSPNWDAAIYLLMNANSSEAAHAIAEAIELITELYQCSKFD